MADTITLGEITVFEMTPVGNLALEAADYIYINEQAESPFLYAAASAGGIRAQGLIIWNNQA